MLDRCLRFLRAAVRGALFSTAASVAAMILLAGCGGERDTLDRARASIAAGDLDFAQRQLSALETAEARDLLAEIDKLRAREARMGEQIDELFARSGELTQNQIREQLKTWREREKDARSRQRLEQALSELTERFTQASAVRRARGEVPTTAKAPVLDEGLGARMRAEVRAALAAKDWQRADELLVMLVDQPVERVGNLSELRATLREGQQAEADQLVAQAHQIEREVSAREAHAWLAKHSERFPPSKSFERLSELLADLDERARSYVAPDETPFTPFELEDDAEAELASAPTAEGAQWESAPEPPDLDAQALIELARTRADAGELAYARRCLLAASGKLFAGDLRDDCVEFAQDLRARLTLRRELLEAWPTHGAKLTRWGVKAIEATGWDVDGEQLGWNALGFERLQRAVVNIESISALARRGAIAEALAMGGADRDAAAEELARMVERGAIESAVAAGMVSRSRGGLGSSQRFLLAQGKWSSVEAAARDEAAAADAELERRFLRADALERTRAFEALTAGASPDTVRAALSARAVAAVTKVAKHRALEQLRAVASLREELDAARRRALELIFDEKVYFYPYNPPEPPNTASDYARAQRDVNEAVGALRAVWERSRAVKLPKDFVAALDELEWCRSTFESVRTPFVLPESVPDWVLALPPGAESVDLTQFAWTMDEQRDLARSRAVEARNERAWAQLDREKASNSTPSTADIAEREQVRITNRYRALFGRRSLAWNSRIQVAAQMHSDYMANTGDFGHFEKDPERRTPSDRARIAGYNSGVSENCAMIGGDPKAAHDGWCQSSGHHRNLLMASHREMASGLASNYWTQNFGADRAFEKELDN